MAKSHVLNFFGARQIRTCSRCGRSFQPGDLVATIGYGRSRRRHFCQSCYSKMEI